MVLTDAQTDRHTATQTDRQTQADEFSVVHYDYFTFMVTSL